MKWVKWTDFKSFDEGEIPREPTGWVEQPGQP